MNELNEQGAHTYWDVQWGSDAGRDRWLKPEPDVEAFVPQLKKHSAQTVLDLGCGVGRHALYLAREGFHVTAVDLSTNGLNHLHQEAVREALEIDLRIAAMTDLESTRRYLTRGPLDARLLEISGESDISTATIDYLLAWNVIYHGDLNALRASLGEIARVLRPAGWFQGTLLSKHNVNFKQGKEIASDTWINADKDDKGHPHCYVNATEMTSMLWDAGLELVQLHHREHEKPGSYHWHLVAERRA